MNAREVQDQLSLFLGLDDATISEQIVPHLQSLKTRADLQDYLTGLLGNETAQSSFIRAYSESRFPPTAPVPERKPTPQPHSATQKARVQLSSPAPAPTRQPEQSTSKVQVVSSAIAQAGRSATSKSDAQPSINLAPSVTARAASPLPPPSGPLRTKAPEGISQSASADLLKVERNIRYAKGQGEKIACFCQTTLHPQHPITPICTRCLLVLCDLNVPYTSPCPSCGNASLASTSMLEQFAKAQEIERDTIIRTEEARMRYESEEEERARRAVQFPTLDNLGAYANTQVTSQMGYASKAGGMDHYKQIEKAYKDAQAREKAAQEGPRKVLSLDTKTKKARIQTTSLSKAKQPAQPTKKAQASVSELEDDRQPYVDVLDDGIRKDNDTPPILGEWPPKGAQGLTYVPSVNVNRREIRIADNDD